MKKILLALAFTGMAAIPSLAQDVIFRTGPSGITVRGGDDGGPRYRDRRRWGDDNPGNRYGWRNRGQQRCRWVAERRERPNGTIVVRRVQRCWR